MKFSSGLVLATLAFTVAHAGDPNNLRSTDSKDLTDDELDYLLDPNTDLDDITLVVGKESNDQNSSRMKNMQSISDNDSGLLVQDEIRDVIKKDKGSTYVDKKQSGDVAWMVDIDPETGNDDKTVKARKSGFSDQLDIEDCALTDRASTATYSNGNLMGADNNVDDSQSQDQTGDSISDFFIKEAIDYRQQRIDAGFDVGSMADDMINNPVLTKYDPMATDDQVVAEFARWAKLYLPPKYFDSSYDGSAMEDDDGQATKSTQMNNMDVTVDDNGNNPTQMETTDDEGNNPFQMDMTNNVLDVNDPVMVKDVATKGRAPASNKMSTEDESPLQFE